MDFLIPDKNNCTSSYKTFLAILLLRRDKLNVS